MERALYTRLSTYAPLTALVSTKIEPLIMPQGTVPPYITYTVISKPSTYSHSGKNRTVRARVQISCYGTTYASAKGVAAQVKAAMESWTSATVKRAFHENDFDSHIAKEEKGGVDLYHLPVDFFVNYYE
jgi:hypothetical protein